MLKRLRFQLFCVETFSSLPKCQSNGRDFARQRQTSHLRLHALGQQSRVEIVEGSPGAAASLPYVSGSRPKTRVAGFAARRVIHPAVGRATPRGAGNAPASVQCLKPIHHSCQIFADGLITARQLSQRPESIFSVVDRSQKNPITTTSVGRRLCDKLYPPAFDTASRQACLL